MQLPEAEFLFPDAFNNIIMNNFSHFPISKVSSLSRRKKRTMEVKKKDNESKKKKNPMVIQAKGEN